MSYFVLGWLMSRLFFFFSFRVCVRFFIVSQVREDSGTILGELIAALNLHLNGERRSSYHVYSRLDLVRLFFQSLYVCGL